MTPYAGTSPKVRLTFYSDCAYYGGAEGYLLLLARHIDRSAFELSALVPPGEGGQALAEGMRACGAAVRHLERPGFTWRGRLPAMIGILREIGGEVLHMNLPSCYDAGISSIAWAARQAGYRRVVSTEHLPMIERKYRKFPTKIVFSHWVDAILVHTRANRDLLVRRHGMDPEKIRVVPNGVDVPPPLSEVERTELRDAWGVPDAAVVIGIVGRLTRRKGHHVLLDALAALSRTPGGGRAEQVAGGPMHAVRPGSPGDPDWRLVAIGDGEEEDALRAQARALGIADRVRFTGPGENAARQMGAFDLFTLPSFVETMPLSILEAMAASLPVVATAVYGVPEVVEHGRTGLLADAGDVAALRDHLERLLREPDLRRSMGEAGRALYERRYTAERMARRTEAAYLGLDGPEMREVAPGGRRAVPA